MQMCMQEVDLWGADEDEVLNKCVKYPWTVLHHSWPVQSLQCLAVSGQACGSPGFEGAV